MATVKGPNAMITNGNRLFWIVVGTMVAAIIGAWGTVFWQVQDARTDIELLKADVSYMKAQVDTIAEIVTETKAVSDAHGWQEYAAWRYQLNVNNMVRKQLSIHLDDWPAPPNHLEAMP